MKKISNLSKKDIKNTFKKLSVEKKDKDDLQKWIEISNKNNDKKSSIWIVTDSNSKFTNINSGIYG